MSDLFKDSIEPESMIDVRMQLLFEAMRLGVSNKGEVAVAAFAREDVLFLAISVNSRSQLIECFTRSVAELLDLEMSDSDVKVIRDSIIDIFTREMIVTAMLKELECKHNV